MGFHSEADEADIHQVHNATYATRSARESATYAAVDVGKIVKQTDEDSFWLVTATTPTFKRVDCGASIITSTTDATETTAWSKTLADNSAYWIESKVVAMITDGSGRSVYKIGGLFYRDGGSATQQGSTVEMITAIEGSLNGTVTYDVTSNDVRLRIAGVGATNISWNNETVITMVI